jgi:dTDP-4-dehydrorhamnose reductase
MKILIVGSNGQLGKDLAQQALHRGWQVGGADLPECDITRTESIERCLQTFLPMDAVINAAAYTAVDAAESHPETAFAVNRDGVGILADACGRFGSALIHVSTDYVFEGLLIRPLLPTDPIGPQGVYARSKAEGETVLREKLERHVIVRTSWLFGLHGPNFVKTMLRLAKERETLRVVDDQFGCPTYAGDLAGALLDIAAHITGSASGWGTYHYCNQTPVTWYDFCRRILESAAAYEQLQCKEIIPIPTKEYPLPAPRPFYSVLDCGSLEETFKIDRRSWEEALSEMLAQLYRG